MKVSGRPGLVGAVVINSRKSISKLQVPIPANISRMTLDEMLFKVPTEMMLQTNE